MKFNELKFTSHDCCAQHQVAEVTLPTMDVLAIRKQLDGTFSVTTYNHAGLKSRELGLTEAQVATRIAAA